MQPKGSTAPTTDAQCGQQSAAIPLQMCVWEERARRRVMSMDFEIFRRQPQVPKINEDL
jgi:hypothetical protein